MVSLDFVAIQGAANPPNSANFFVANEVLVLKLTFAVLTLEAKILELLAQHSVAFLLDVGFTAVRTSFLFSKPSVDT